MWRQGKWRRRKGYGSPACTSHAARRRRCEDSAGELAQQQDMLCVNSFWKGSYLVNESWSEQEQEQQQESVVWHMDAEEQQQHQQWWTAQAQAQT